MDCQKWLQFQVVLIMSKPKLKVSDMTLEEGIRNIMTIRQEIANGQTKINLLVIKSGKVTGDELMSVERAIRKTIALTNYYRRVYSKAKAYQAELKFIKAFTAWEKECPECDKETLSPPDE